MNLPNAAWYIDIRRTLVNIPLSYFITWISIIIIIIIIIINIITSTIIAINMFIIILTVSMILQLWKIKVLFPYVYITVFFSAFSFRSNCLILFFKSSRVCFLLLLLLLPPTQLVSVIYFTFAFASLNYVLNLIRFFKQSIFSFLHVFAAFIYIIPLRNVLVPA